MRVNEKHSADFTGTTFYFKMSLLDSNIVGTEGTLFIAEEYNAFWLFDVIASHLSKVRDPFVVMLLDHSPTPQYENRFVFSIQDDIPMNKQYVKQTIPHSDFPKEGVQFYAQKNGKQWVVYLPSEH